MAKLETLTSMSDTTDADKNVRLVVTFASELRLVAGNVERCCSHLGVTRRLRLDLRLQ